MAHQSPLVLFEAEGRKGCHQEEIDKPPECPANQHTPEQSRVQLYQPAWLQTASCTHTGGPQHTECQATDNHINIKTVALFGGKKTLIKSRTFKYLSVCLSG